MERIKGLAATILNELSNHVMEKFPEPKGMTGGDQPFLKPKVIMWQITYRHTVMIWKYIWHGMRD